MRPWILAATAAVLLVLALFAVPAAQAAPTCLDRSGVTVRCATPGAMPVGWTLPPEDRLALEAASPVGPSPNELFEMVCLIGGLLALFALMPEFDGRHARDWGRQEGDDEDRK